MTPIPLSIRPNTNKPHTLVTPETCDCRTKNRPDWDFCPVCDWGLGVCGKCGRAECELDEPCEPRNECLECGADQVFLDHVCPGPTYAI